MIIHLVCRHVTHSPDCFFCCHFAALEMIPFFIFGLVCHHRARLLRKMSALIIVP